MPAMAYWSPGTEAAILVYSARCSLHVPPFHRVHGLDGVMIRALPRRLHAAER